MMQILGFIGGKKYYFYALLAAVIVSFFSGSYLAWKVRGAFQTSKNMKVIESDVKIIEEQNDVDATSYDSDAFRNGILRNGRL